MFINFFKKSSKIVFLSFFLSSSLFSFSFSLFLLFIQFIIVIIFFLSLLSFISFTILSKAKSLSLSNSSILQSSSSIFSSLFSSSSVFFYLGIQSLIFSIKIKDFICLGKLVFILSIKSNFSFSF